jgi:1,4-alpha-glucan branching enzyme
MPGDDWQKFANLRLLYGFMYGHPGKNLLFMGGEIGVWREWNHDTSLDWDLLQWPLHQGLQRFVQDLNRLQATEPSLHQIDFEWGGFSWIDHTNVEQSVVVFVRRALDPSDHIIFASNFTPLPRFDYRFGVPEPVYYREVLNSDAAVYGGSNLGNSGGVHAEEIPAHGYPYSVSITVPPLGLVALKPWRDD